MRSLAGTLALAMAVFLTGCRSGPNTLTGGGGKGGDNAFVGSRTGDSGTPAVEGKEPVEGLTASDTRHKSSLIGTVMFADGEAVPGAKVAYVDVLTPAAGALRALKADKFGNFAIDGLPAGREYRLTVRHTVAGREYVGSVVATTPKNVVIIRVVDVGAGTTTPVGTSEGTTTDKAEETPKVPGVGGSDGVTGTTTPVNPAQIAEEKPKPGIDTKPAPPTVNVPGPADAKGAPAGPSSEKPADDGVKAEVPSCVKPGDRVENFALYHTSGQVYEWRKHAKGQLVLLDFFFTDCAPCRKAIPEITALQRKYARDGLEVLGVSSDRGTTVEECKASLSNGMRRYNLDIPYPVLFAGLGAGGPDKCPVTRKLGVHGYPTLVLLHRDGRVLYTGNGLVDHRGVGLEDVIRRNLPAK